MAEKVRIAVDAMGGDFGPSVTVPGCALALERMPESQFLLFGDETAIRAELANHPRLAERAEIRHSSVTVRMDDKPSQALRYGRRVSSMWMAVEAVKKGEADAAISAGNTGALMAMSKICLRTMARVDRPALACLWPTLRGQSIVLDVGASIGANASHLVDLAIMGSAMARIILGLERPTVGLLNVGTEEIKGVEEVKAAAAILRETDLPGLEYAGFVEGDGIGMGAVDVVVTEGFTGNITLKTAEGTAKQIAAYLKAAMSGSLFAKIGYLFARGAFAELKGKMDTRAVNGGVFLGLEGIVIKSHGGTDSVGFARAVEIGYEMAKNDLMNRIRDTVALAHQFESGAADPASPPQETAQ
ncbi:phosphate acyltransferase PlsX [Methylocystis sp. MJC1]|jgi:glycerol-3-phosphate acyltransferase PlsX|uniref:phosphate acyltransferase PlsX n=1 Tax=Methylocystis sp. MJC1 TaxID=2654282 RepID=UPI0013EDF519|nr:phosphate acyltransferase PlsX [Methylocystis sp. MJC1]KAF2989355.1 Phosphate acyltransferase [Methylocystis sp. MJC1]MBU6526894.1 phosphate acyltransferase PlsX [Methylocystis sp. MJC1]UZX13329.1 phosphate acyltransferase PlsX [Methylocystis sp. MJC1]